MALHSLADRYFYVFNNAAAWGNQEMRQILQFDLSVFKPPHFRLTACGLEFQFRQFVLQDSFVRLEH